MSNHNGQMRWIFLVLVVLTAAVIAIGLGLYDHHQRLKKAEKERDKIWQTMEMSFEAVDERLERVDEFPLTE
jgi:hypothetical protein